MSSQINLVITQWSLYIKCVNRQTHTSIISNLIFEGHFRSGKRGLGAKQELFLAFGLSFLSKKLKGFKFKILICFITNKRGSIGDRLEKLTVCEPTYSTVIIADKSIEAQEREREN